MSPEERTEKILDIAREHAWGCKCCGEGVGEAARAAILAEVKAAIEEEVNRLSSHPALVCVHAAAGKEPLGLCFACQDIMDREVKKAVLDERSASAAAICLGCASNLPILTARHPDLPLFHLSGETDLFQQCMADPILRRKKE